MRTYKHWTPRYIYDRVAVMLYEKKNPGTPWLTRQMIEILDEWLKPDDVGLEWGSGRSTLWFAKRLAHLTSIEDNPLWFENIRQLLIFENLTHKADYKLLKPLENGTPESDYVKAINPFLENSLDFCLVDGTERDFCALACIPKIKPGGIIVIDNIERYIPRQVKTRSPNARGKEDGFASKGWEEFGIIVAKWRCIWTSNGVSDTAFWVKPL